MEINVAILIVLLVLVLLIFNRQLSYLVGSVKNALSSMFQGPSEPDRLSCGCIAGQCSCVSIPDESYMHKEQLTDPDDNLADDANMMEEEGYEGNMPWDEVLQATELDPATHDNHRQFVADTRRFSSGANFTSVTDDNTNWSFTQFVGLRRPQHVHIGWDARSQPDVDQSVLQRNKDLRF